MSSDIFRTAIGQDHHSFDLSVNESEGIMMGGIKIPCDLSFSANSDGDVLLHALTNAISGISGIPVLGKIADEMCKSGITDSKMYVKKSIEEMKRVHPYSEIIHVSFSIEALKPHFSNYIKDMRSSVANILGIGKDNVGITATTGEQLTGMGQGLGIAVLCIITVMDKRL